MPLVSVIIPTFNHADYIVEAIESIFAQTFTDYEVIVINDGSTDVTRERLGPLVQSGRIQYVEQANAGQAAARNRGIALAGGEFIALLDDDDRWEPDKLAWQVESLRQHPQAPAVYGQVRTFEAESFIAPAAVASASITFDDFASRGGIYSPGQALLRADAVRRVGLFDESIRGADDWDLYLRLSKEADFVFQPRVALHYRRHASNASKDVRRMWRESLSVVEKHFSPGGRSPSQSRRNLGREFVKSMTTADCFRYAEYHASRGELDRAVDLLWLAARIDLLKNAKPSLKAWLHYRHPVGGRALRERVSWVRIRLAGVARALGL